MSMDTKDSLSPILLFPGQGSQVPGMGRDVADSSRDAMDLWKLAERTSRLPLREICWEGDEAAMSDTRVLQPALTVVNLSLWRMLAGRVRPMAAAGHSLGEYSALAAAQVLSVEAVLEIVSLRGALMADADPMGKGAMAAILKLDRSQVQSIVDEVAAETGEPILIANDNTPVQQVVSGTKTAVAMVCERAKASKGRGLELKVSGAFHSPMMAVAAKELAPLLSRAVWAKPRFPVYLNVTGCGVADGESVKDAMLVQMTSPVRWTETVQRQYGDGARAWLELGPKAVLGKMVPACLAPLAPTEEVSVALVGDAGSAETWGCP
jgi:[acyl-carrier-protein] S-malonyltransferase